jgi:hypothetical protein
MSFGNAVGQGFVNPSEVITNIVVIEGTKGGLFVYNGVPARGSLIGVISGAAGTDPYGNVYGQGINFGVWSATTGLQEQHFGVDDNGNLYLVDATDTTRIFLDAAESVIFMQNDAFTYQLAIASASGSVNLGTAYTFPAGISLAALPVLVYSGTPAAGNLIAILAPGAGSDVFGNSWGNEGFTILGSNGSKLIATLQSGVPYFVVSTGASEELNGANIQAIITNPGASETMQAFFRGPQGSVHTDYAQVDLGSAAKDGSLTATGALGYIDTSSVTHEFLEWGNTGVRVFSDYAGDPNGYRTESLTVTQASDLPVNSVTPAQFLQTVDVGTGLYHVHGQIILLPNQAAGQAKFELVAGGGAVATMRISFNGIQIGGPGTLGNSVDVTAFGTSYPTAAFANANEVVVTFDGTMQVSTAGDFGIFASCSVAADTYDIRALGSYMEINPIGT